jgi:hypothetical protein
LDTSHRAGPSASTSGDHGRPPGRWAPGSDRPHVHRGSSQGAWVADLAYVPTWSSLTDLDLLNRGGVQAHGDGRTAVTHDDDDDVAGCPEDVSILAERWVRPGVSRAFLVDTDDHHVNGPWDSITGRQCLCRHQQLGGSRDENEQGPRRSATAGATVRNVASIRVRSPTGDRRTH